MSTFRKIFLWVFVLVSIFFFGIYIYIKANGKAIFERELGLALNRQVNVQDVRFIFPVGLRVDGLKIKGLLHAKEVRVRLGFPVILGKEHIISSVVFIQPLIVLQREEESKILVIDPVFKGEKKDRAEQGGVEEKDQSLTDEIEKELGAGFFIDHLEIQDGTIDFSDYSKEKEIKLTIKDINLKAETFAFPLEPVNTRFHFSASILNNYQSFSGSQVEGEGWINFLKRDMEGGLEIIEPNGKISLKADLKSVDNELTVVGKLNINSLASSRKKSEEGEDFSLDDFILGALQSASIEINVDFVIKTKLDDINLNSIAFTGKVGYERSKEPSSTISIQKSIKDIGKQLYEKSVNIGEKKEEQEEVKD